MWTLINCIFYTLIFIEKNFVLLAICGITLLLIISSWIINIYQKIFTFHRLQIKKRIRKAPIGIMDQHSEVFSIPLTLEANAVNTLYRLKCNSILHVHPNVELLGRKIVLYTNYPREGDKFTRTGYRILDWYLQNGHKITTNKYPSVHVVDTDIYAEIQVKVSGTFRFWFHYKESKAQELAGELFVQVEPSLYVGPPEQPQLLSLDSIRCQTVLSKLLGPLDSWESKLRVAKETGYNMIHFTPIQELGNSRSAYSIRNQLCINPRFNRDKGKKTSYKDVEEFIRKIRHEWHMASICDIVLNHTANESDWLLKYPEASYSCATCPYLRPAFLLDALLSLCSDDISKGLLELHGVPSIIDQESHLDALKYQLHEHYLPKIKLYELYQCNSRKYVEEFIEEMRCRPPPTNVAKESRFTELQLIPDPQYKRLGCTIDINLALEIFNSFHGDCFDEESRLRKCADTFRRYVERLNEEVRVEIGNYLNCAITNCLAAVRYERVQPDGPRLGEITDKHPLFMQYFTQTKVLGQSLQQIEKAMYSETGEFFMAHNGWVMGTTDVLKDFAAQQPGHGNVYLKRELIAWGDSVKLRYGAKPSDSPYLWQYMTDYVIRTAQIFDGVRLDNCHSTPIHVAEYLLDAAREINPNLYVVAELFTNSDATDNIFVNRLGITSLIREAQSAWDSHEQGRLVYRYGGSPVGDFLVHPQRHLAPSIAHALFMDLTHDNPSPVEKRSIYDLLPSSALVAMACCATGSNRGYDELVPHHIHVVDETRTYQSWDREVNINTGIIAAKKALNLLHEQLTAEGFSQVYVDQIDANIVAVTRHCRNNHDSVILVAHTAFNYPQPCAGATSVRPLTFEGHLKEIILEAEFSMKGGDTTFAKPSSFTKDSCVLNGYQQFQLIMREHIPLTQTNIFHPQALTNESNTKLEFVNLKPGSIVVVRVSLHNNVPRDHLQQLTQAVHYRNGSSFEELENIANSLNLLDLNTALFTCDAEERDMGFGGGAYNVPNYGTLVYCGLQGVVSVLAEISPRHDLGHPLCNNLREGNWMLDYITERLSHHEGTKTLSQWLQAAFDPLKKMPRYLIPSYFDALITGVYNILVDRVYHLMPNFIKNGHKFPKLLALATLQFVGLCKTAHLPPLSPTLIPQPLCLAQSVTLSAGLPHFSTGYMRCWGRDTFISLRGLMFLTGRFAEARLIILGFGQCLRHGLIPNLLDSGNKPRFNCRDAVWWWLYSIKQYVEEAPKGKQLLQDKVSRIYPYDHSAPYGPGQFDQALIDVMQEALQVHFQGLVFRERNAGPEIDAHMTDEGFNNQIGVHPETGFVFGGNRWNCGTWMDKMGSSEKAGNRGRPSTPRDGTAVELVGLQYAVLRFMQNLSESSSIEYKSVKRLSSNGQITTTWLYKDWADCIKRNFEKCFHVNEASDCLPGYKINIYKDCYGATQNGADFQLRCNFPIAMVVASDLFHPLHAWSALEIVREKLLGPLGIKTLDPDDCNYRGYYDNANDSADGATAHGANYHQGPEWLWPIGYYLRARLIFGKKLGHLNHTITETWNLLRAHLNELETSNWRGLPELTNENGAFCRDSCRTQAWSIATIMEVLYDLHSLGGDV